MFSIKVSFFLLFLATVIGTKTRKILYWSLATAPPIIELIRYEELKEEMANETINPFIIDIRDRNETNATGMIPTALNIPTKELKEAMVLPLEEFEQKYNISKPRYKRRVVIYGKSEFQGLIACRLITGECNYKWVANYAAGWMDWYNRTWDEQDDRYWENQDTKK